MLQPAYKVSHWYPYPTITTGYDAWGNSTEETPVEEYYLNKYEESGEPSSSDFFLFFLFCECKDEKLYYVCKNKKHTPITSPPVRQRESTPG